jgi:exo-beta-1,3-glucanase (GH17 family)
MQESETEVNFDKEVKKIVRMTDDNDHSRALMVGAQLLNKIDGTEEHFADEFKKIYLQHQRDGHLSKQQSDKRSGLSSQFFDYAKNVLTPEQWTKFHDAY